MSYPLLQLRRAWAALAVVVAAGAAESVDFNRQILPILSDACFNCHGPDAGSRKAKLRLDQREGIFRTREDITVVTPGDPARSELFLRITSKEEDEVMPPPEANRQLKPDEVALLRKWIAAGAPWGLHWAFTPPVRPEVPALPKSVGATAARLTPVDAFVGTQLAASGLAFAPEADRPTLLRRVTLELTGVPPTPAELDAFLADRSPDAYERVVDRLIASPRYGERWAWDWLDLARYADTNGFQGDPERTMWPWRDWVVNALNANMPYDQFTIEQLAGDLLPDATREQKLASGFHRNNMFNGEGGRIAEETRVENVFDRVETTATVWLGATFTCARCHDHKYDPITQKDYYAMFDVFNQMSETGSAGGQRGQIAPVLDMSTDAERERVKKTTAAVEAAAKEVEAFEVTKFPRPEGRPLAESPDALKLPGNLPATLAKVEPRRRGVDSLLEAIPHFKTTEPDPAYAALLQKLLTAVRARDTANSNITKVMIMDELPKPRDTFMLNKGNYESKTDVKVTGAIPSMFARAHGSEPGAPVSRPLSVADAGGTPALPEKRFNRLDLARWLVSAENPLVARVTVNRAWQAFFGTGLVKTAEDFGAQGERPSHPELLDWLATEFVRSGWDMKALHRLIATSATYRQSSRVTAALYERDPENRLLARGPRHRMPSWMIRDQALAAAGLLMDKPGGPSVNPYQPAGIWEEATFGKKTYKQDHGTALYRRSLYVFWRRIVGPTSFFDAGARQVCTVKVARTNTPLHALVTLNDPAFVEAARVLAQGASVAADTDAARLDYVFRVVTSRLPVARERTILLERLARLRTQFAADPASALQLAATGEAARPETLDAVEHAAWTALCSLLLNLDETLSRE
ncbi:PSD1 and planctomycete cytochrome C domain-containing protein [Horticoccus sp. 23ND18S-11]|uniref:PSD1 and planctomycete cytochrome C domain-containing protein n=1 Tax=Horticoccus sp. 23ND18S-11 TaxID=3391832 RepID=UPI0039C97DCA